VAVGTITSYAWDFGDGDIDIATTPTATHTYSTGGAYTATLTVTDSAGTSMTQIFTGNTVSRNGGTRARTTRSVSVANTLGFVSTPGSTSFTGTLGGRDQTVTGGLALDVAAGLSTGWNLSATSTTFSTGGGTPRTLPTSATTLRSAPTVACDTTCTLASNSVAYPWTLPAGATAPTATKLYSAAAGSGIGNQTVTPTFSVALPANTYAGSYSSTWTFTLASGP
jgi:PKD repeat protein